MNYLSLLRKRWKRLKLPIVFYHTTFVENAPLILKEQKIIANEGQSVCKENNGVVSLSDKITKGIIEFFGNVVFEFDAVSLHRKNKSIAPRDYGISEDDIVKYDELPFFENEWVAPKKLKFDLADINKVLLITSRDFKESTFEDVVTILKSKDIEYCFLSEKWLSDNILPDTTRYFFRIENWRKFIK
jgi:hypothetical protein